MNFSFGLASDIGRRKSSNQDRVLIKIGEARGIGEFALFAVADGMGGMTAGETASKLAMEALKCWWSKLDSEEMTTFGLQRIGNDLQDQFSLINDLIKDYGKTKGIRLGTTLSVLFIAGSKYVLCHTGDSRVYLLANNNSELRQLTVDHTYVAELVRKKLILPADVRNHPNINVLTHCLGIRGHTEVFKAEGNLAGGEVFLLCSDGLYNKVDNDCIATTILRGFQQGNDVQNITEQLISTANHNGGNDNISLIVLKCNHNSTFKQGLTKSLKKIFAVKR